MTASKVGTYMVPDDFSPVADCAMEHAASCAKISGATVKLVHVITKETLSKLKMNHEDVEKRLTERVEKLESKFGVNAGYVAVEGSIFSAIGEEAEEVGANLVFMGTHGVVGLEQKLLGAFAVKVINSSPSPVVVVQKKSPDADGYKKIVYPIDHTRQVKQKLNDAIKVAKLFGAEVHIFEGIEKDEYLANDRKRNVAHAIKGFNEAGVKYVHAKGEADGGDYHKQVIRYAGSVSADLIVILTATETSVKKMIIGQEEEKIINNDAQIPVMCVNQFENTRINDAIVY